MNQLLLATVLVSATANIQDGSLIFLEDSNKPVAKWTGSTITHVALIVHRDGRPWVYEATPAEVRRVPLSGYYAEIAASNEDRKKTTKVWLLEPQRAFSPYQRDQLGDYIESQLGRRYSVRGYVRNKQSDGMHCSEFAASALASTGCFEFQERHFGISPTELFHYVREAYETPLEIPIARPKYKKSWCSRAWTNWFNFREWCGWACYETWTFCR